jgi:hypothetical protein
VTGAHSDIGPELRKLAQKILDQIDPAVRLAAAAAVGDGPGTGKCQQVWCPVCALAAIVSGDEHPLLTVIAEHSVTLLAVIRCRRVAISPSPSPLRTSSGEFLPHRSTGGRVLASRKCPVVAHTLDGYSCR